MDQTLVVSQYSSTPMGKIAPETANDSGSTYSRSFWTMSCCGSVVPERAIIWRCV
jgi:hypothetical protein